MKPTTAVRYHLCYHVIIAVLLAAIFVMGFRLHRAEQELACDIQIRRATFNDICGPHGTMPLRDGQGCEALFGTLNPM